MIDLAGPHGGLIAMGFAAGWVACWGVLETVYKNQVARLREELEAAEKRHKEAMDASEERHAKDNDRCHESIKALNKRLAEIEDNNIRQLTLLIEKMSSVQEKVCPKD